MNGNNRFNGQETIDKQFRVRTSRRPDRFRHVIETRITEDLEGKTELISLERCAGCSKIIHNITEADALCSVCLEPLCGGCSKIRCAIATCKKSICPGHAVAPFFGPERYFCVTHSWWEQLGK